MADPRIDKISPNDSRVQQRTAVLNGITYSYLLAEPSGTPSNTIFLIHGFPDLSLGWRYQIPVLTSLGLRVIALDMMGYSGTDAPDEIKYYTYKRAADDVATLAKRLGLSSIILGGHDWGGAIVYRIAMYYPKLISAFFSICTPFQPPKTKYVPASSMPNFKYQLQFGGPDLEREISGEEKIKQFLNAMYGGRGPKGEPAFHVSHGAYMQNLPILCHTILLSKPELDYYTKRYAIHGMHGPTNWYRNGELNFEDEKQFAQAKFKFEMPVLFVGGTRDAALPPALSSGMEKWFRSLTRGEVDASHWALWEKPADVNQYLVEWLGGLGGLKGRANL
ncbi:epoxide hydrolase [Calycina marina]|uniref:Epoxide hydrolase n=1 Tax=Calycina marina TaxID=1763456 RepID=A0A9P7YVQ9_9HELO|nr:epoxide hydrolase [Calycina marina]